MLMPISPNVKEEMGNGVNPPHQVIQLYMYMQASLLTKAFVIQVLQERTETRYVILSI